MVNTEDIIGKKFGKLIVTKFLKTDEESKTGWKYFYLCDCACGKKNNIVNRVGLISNRTKSCGCIKGPIKNPQDIINKKFGLLTVEKFLKSDKSKYPWKYYYSCVCACGTNKIVTRVNLISNHALSCGCMLKRKGKDSKSWKGYGDLSSSSFTSIKHHAKTRNLKFNITIRDAWNQFIKQNKKCALTGVELIMDSFKNTPTNKTASLDRINSDKGYTPDNIQWVHKDINYIKMDVDQRKFIDLCKLVAKYNK